MQNTSVAHQQPADPVGTRNPSYPLADPTAAGPLPLATVFQRHRGSSQGIPVAASAAKQFDANPALNRPSTFNVRSKGKKKRINMNGIIEAESPNSSEASSSSPDNLAPANSIDDTNSLASADSALSPGSFSNAKQVDRRQPAKQIRTYSSKPTGTRKTYVQGKNWANGSTLEQSNSGSQFKNQESHVNKGYQQEISQNYGFLNQQNTSFEANPEQFEAKTLNYFPQNYSAPQVQQFTAYDRFNPPIANSQAVQLNRTLNFSNINSQGNPNDLKNANSDRVALKSSGTQVLANTIQQATHNTFDSFKVTPAYNVPIEPEIPFKGLVVKLESGQTVDLNEIRVNRQQQQQTVVISKVEESPPKTPVLEPEVEEKPACLVISRIPGSLPVNAELSGKIIYDESAKELQVHEAVQHRTVEIQVQETFEEKVLPVVSEPEITPEPMQEIVKKHCYELSELRKMQKLFTKLPQDAQMQHFRQSSQQLHNDKRVGGTKKFENVKYRNNDQNGMALRDASFLKKSSSMDSNRRHLESFKDVAFNGKPSGNAARVVGYARSTNDAANSRALIGHNGQKKSSALVQMLRPKIDESNPEEIYKRDLTMETIRRLNMLTEENFDEISTFFVGPYKYHWAIHMVLKLILTKAFTEPKFVELYAKLSAKITHLGLATEESRSYTKEELDGERVQFLKGVVMQCEQQFRSRPSWTLPNPETATPEEMEESIKLKVKSLGNMKFLGYLYLYGALTNRSMFCTIGTLLVNEDPAKLEENLESISVVLKIIAPAFMTIGLDSASEILCSTIGHVESGKLSMRVQCLLSDALNAVAKVSKEFTPQALKRWKARREQQIERESAQKGNQDASTDEWEVVSQKTGARASSAQHNAKTTKENQTRPASKDSSPKICKNNAFYGLSNLDDEAEQQSELDDAVLEEEMDDSNAPQEIKTLVGKIKDGFKIMRESSRTESLEKSISDAFQKKATQNSVCATRYLLYNFILGLAELKEIQKDDAATIFANLIKNKAISGSRLVKALDNEDIRCLVGEMAIESPAFPSILKAISEAISNQDQISREQNDLLQSIFGQSVSQ